MIAAKLHGLLLLTTLFCCGCPAIETNTPSVQEQESLPPAAEEAKSPQRAASPSAAEAAARSAELVARLRLVRGVTTIDKGPHEEVLAALVDAGASGAWVLVSPLGTALGLGARGDGQAFAEAVGKQLGTMVEDKLVRAFLALARFSKYSKVELEVSLGQPMWIRAGVALSDVEQVRVVLEEEKVSAAEIARLLADVGSEGELRRLSWHVVPDRGASIAVETEVLLLPGNVAGGEAAKGATELLVERVAGQPNVAYVRRNGLLDNMLIDWQVKRGLGVGEAKRLGKVHGYLGVEGPDQISWQAGGLPQTLVYRYPVMR